MPHLTGPGTRNRAWWDEERDAYLRAHYRKGQVAVIAAALGVTPKAVVLRAIVLGLSRPPARRIAWTPDRLALLKRLYGIVPPATLADQLGCTPGALIRKAREVGLQAATNRAGILDTAERNTEKAAILLAREKGLISPAQAALALDVPPGRLPRLAVEVAMWAARSIERERTA